jgi:uncharacterized protein YggE
MPNKQSVFLGLGLVAVAPWLIGASLDGSSVEDRRTVITVTGRAEEPQQPALVVLAAGVESDASTASRAMGDNAEIMARLRRILERMNIRPQDVRTASLSLTPQRDPHEGTRIIGFRATHRLTITFRDIEQSGHVIDALVDVGANNIEGPRLASWGRGERADPRARQLAIVDANNQAQAYARSLGLHVRRVLKMNDGGTHVTQNPQAIAARGPGTEIMPGEEFALTTVNAEYELVR